MHTPLEKIQHSIDLLKTSKLMKSSPLAISKHYACVKDTKVFLFILRKNGYNKSLNNS